MTVQILDTMTHAGFRYSMPDFPLEHLWALKGVNSPFPSLHTANGRGYKAHWVIQEGALFLESVLYYSEKQEEWVNALPRLFPDCGPLVWAHWYSGGLRFGLHPCTGIPPRRYWVHFELENRVTVKQGRIIDEDLFYHVV